MREWILYLIFVSLMVAGVFGLYNYAHAEEEQSVVSDNCELQATIKGIEYYWCKGDSAPDFMANTVGFTVLEQ